MTERQRIEMALYRLRFDCGVLWHTALAKHDAYWMGYARKALAVCETAIEQIREPR